MTAQSSLQVAVARFLEVDPSDLNVLTWREDRIVCRATTARGEVVAKASVDTHAFVGEVRAIERLRQADLPVSKILMIAEEPVSILVAAWTAGTPINASSPLESLHAVGAMLARIHRIEATPPVSSHESIAAWITTWFHSLMHWASNINALDTDLLRVAEHWFSEIKPILDTRTPAMMLFDGRPEHFLVDDAGTVRLIDVADLQPGDPAMDLAVLELDAPGILSEVLNGYSRAADNRVAFQQLVSFYLFLRALSGAEWQQRMTGDTQVASRYLAEAREVLIAREGQRD